MRISQINVEGIGGIDNLSVSFDSQMNLICGPNGIGKTTILESVAHAFSNGTTRILKKKANFERDSSVSVLVEIDNQPKEHRFAVDVFEPRDSARITGLHEHADHLLSLKTTRTLPYQALDAVAKDADKNQNSSWGEAMQGVQLQDIKNWFVNRFLYSAHEGALSESQIANFELAKSCFSLLNDGFRFKTVKASSNEILISTPTGDIYYEYLSSGFKSCISILFGIIKELEYRFRNEPVVAADFDGIVLIDELELHLHPEWQTKIADLLIGVFPRAQFVCTTHSPHIIQSAEPNQIIALEDVGDGIVSRAIPPAEFGYKGWTVEEVLIDVMGMEFTTTSTLRKALDAFGDAIDREDFASASGFFDQLDNLLHPSNQLRKLLRMQLASIDESEE